MPRWFEMSFEDNIAAYILAFLYSSQHVDVTINLEDLKRELERGMREQEIFLAKRRSHTSYALSKVNARFQNTLTMLQTAEQGAKKELGGNLAVLKREKAKLLKTLGVLERREVGLREEWNVRIREAFEQRFGEAFEVFRANKLREPREEALPQDIELIGRIGQFTEGSEAPEWVEESHYDTVATAVVNRTLYVTCNYKTRAILRLGLAPELEYRGFGFPVDRLDALVAAMSRELSEVWYPRILKIVFLRPFEAYVPMGVEKSAEQYEAYPHAEMQLISYLSTRGKPRRIGVTKECCQRCANRLDQENVRYTWRKEEYYDNWATPEFICMDVLREYHVSWL